MKKTTIQINVKTLKNLSEEEINDKEKGLNDIKRGRIYPIESVAEELGITLK